MVTLINQLRDFEPIPSDVLNRALRSLCQHQHQMEVMEKETDRVFSVMEQSAPEDINARQTIYQHVLTKLQEEKRKIIQVPNGNVEKLAKAARCSTTTVYNALAGRSDSETARSVRKMAINLYGGVSTTKLIL